MFEYALLVLILFLAISKDVRSGSSDLISLGPRLLFRILIRTALATLALPKLGTKFKV